MFTFVYQLLSYSNTFNFGFAANTIAAAAGLSAWSLQNTGSIFAPFIKAIVSRNQISIKGYVQYSFPISFF